MSKRAEEAALKAFPNVAGPYDIMSSNDKREIYIRGYAQAEKDLALNLEQVVKIDNIIMNMVGEGYNDGYKTKPFYEEALRRFNKQK